MKPAFFNSSRDLCDWLDQHHATATELLVGFHKKKTGRGLTYPEALDAALSFGWIDGVRKRLDEEAYTIRFSPRKPGSIWSAVNIRHVRRLIASGQMRPPGLRVFERRDQQKTRLYSYERAAATLDPNLAAVLRANRKAFSFFEAQPPGYRKVVAHWIMSAKKEETRARRLAVLIEHSANGQRIDSLSPSRK